jgi:hypothetical protein
LSVWGSWRSPGWSKEDGLATIFISLILKTYPSELFQRGARGDLLTAGYEVDDRFMADLVHSPRCCLSGCFTRAFMADSMT